MKKLGLGLLAFVIAGAIYYLTIGSKQITSALQQQVTTELAHLQTQGFGVTNQSTKEQSQHFEISMDEPQKIAAFFTQNETPVKPEDLETLKGLKFGVDVVYSKSDAEVEIYPLALPQGVLAEATEPEDKANIAKIEEMFKRKTFLLQATYSPVTSSFKGQLKDINETITGNKETATLYSKALKFNGIYKDDRFQELTQSLHSFGLDAKDNGGFQIAGISSTYKTTGNGKYDYASQTLCDTIKVSMGAEGDFEINGLSSDSTSNEKEGLLFATFESKIKNMRSQGMPENLHIEDIVLDMKVNNFDMAAIEKLQTLDSNDTAKRNAILQQLVSHNIHFEIPHFGAKKVTLGDNNLDGFMLSSTIDIDKSLDFAQLDQNPAAALSSIDAGLNITLSKALFDLASQNPEAMVALMVFQPEVKGDQYTYSAQLKDGAVSVNGQPIQ